MVVDIMQRLFGEGVDTDQVRDGCNMDFDDVLKQLKPGRRELRKIVEGLMVALQEYPLVLELYRKESEIVMGLESCVLCLFREKLILSRKVEAITECKGKNMKTIVCLKADLKLRVDTIVRIDEQISQLLSSEKLHLKKIDSIETNTMETVVETKEITEEIEKLLPKACQLRGKKRSKQQESQKRKQDMMTAHLNWSAYFKGQFESQTESLMRCTEKMEELKNFKIENLKSTIKILSDKIKQHVEGAAIKNDEVEQMSNRVENLRRSIEVREDKLKNCREERQKWMQYKTTQEETMEIVQKELEYYDNEIETIKDDQAEVLRKSREVLEESNKFIQQLAEENCSLSRNLPDTKLVIEDFIFELEHSTNSMRSLYQETESLCRDYNLSDQNSALTASEMLNLTEQEEDTSCRLTSDYLDVIKDMDKLCQYNQLVSEVQEIQDANDLLSQRILELDLVKQNKDCHLSELAKKKNDLCLQYDLQLSRIETYEKFLEDLEKKKLCIESKIESLAFEHDILLNTDWNLKEELQKINDQTKKQYLDHDCVLRENKKLKKKFDRLNESLRFEKENNIKLEKSIETSMKTKAFNLSGITDALNVSHTQEMALQSERRRLINEFDRLGASYNLIMENIKKFEKIIDIQGEKIEKNYRLATRTYSGVSCHANYERKNHVKIVPSNHSGLDQHFYYHDNLDCREHDEYRPERQIGSGCFSGFNILDLAEDS